MYTQINQIFMIHCFTVNTLKSTNSYCFRRSPFIFCVLFFFSCLLGKHTKSCHRSPWFCGHPMNTLSLSPAQIPFIFLSFTILLRNEVFSFQFFSRYSIVSFVTKKFFCFESILHWILINFYLSNVPGSAFLTSYK